MTLGLVTKSITHYIWLKTVSCWSGGMRTHFIQTKPTKLNYSLNKPQSKNIDQPLTNMLLIWLRHFSKHVAGAPSNLHLAKHKLIPWLQPKSPGDDFGCGSDWSCLARLWPKMAPCVLDSCPHLRCSIPGDPDRIFATWLHPVMRIFLRMRTSLLGYKPKRPCENTNHDFKPSHTLLI